MNAVHSSEILFFENIQELIGRKHDLERLQKRINKLELTSKEQKLTDKIFKDEKKISHEISSLLKTQIKNFNNEIHYSKAV